MHFTSTFRGAEAIKHLCNPDDPNPVSAHIVVDLDGTITQLVPFNLKAWHAGQSSFSTFERTYSGLNDYSIGIELVNPGWFVKTPDDLFLHEGESPIDHEKLASFHPFVNAPSPNGGEALWAAYPKVQIDVLEELTSAILDAYPSITHVLGHADISPVRKVDPGPAFPMERFTRLLLPPPFRLR